MKKICLYLVARISQDAHAWNDKVVSNLNPELFETFKPHEHNPWNQKHETFAKNVFDMDLTAIKNSHIGLCLPEFGRDCSWECGWYGNSKKPLVFFIDNQITWLRDWMIKGGLDYVVTTNKNTYDILINDPILKHKQIILIDNMSELNTALENIYKNHYKNKFFGHILNLRPYSWIDMLLVGFAAKFLTTKELEFVQHDLYMAIGILALWFFFNAILEMKHDYAYREKVSAIFPIVYLAIAIIVSIVASPIALIFTILSTLLVLVYLQKNKNAALGIASSIVRGVIQSMYFFFALMFYSKEINPKVLAVGIIIFLLYTARAIVGDIRDIKQNTKSRKKTIPVTFGLTNSKLLVVLLLSLATNIGIIYFGSLFVFLPLLLFAIGMSINKHGFVLHQLIIPTTSFFTVNLIALFTNQNILFFNLIFLGIWLNFIFYPLLKRKSNPIFAEQIQ